MHRRTIPPRLRLLLAGSSRAARTAFGVLALVGSLVGLARMALPNPSALGWPTARTSLDLPTDTVSDDPGPSINEARLPRSGTRRAVVPGAAFPLDRDAAEDLDSRSRVLPARDVLAPASFVPSPPFHPPRLS